MSDDALPEITKESLLARARSTLDKESSVAGGIGRRDSLGETATALDDNILLDLACSLNLCAQRMDALSHPPDRIPDSVKRWLFLSATQLVGGTGRSCSQKHVLEELCCSTGDRRGNGDNSCGPALPGYATQEFNGSPCRARIGFGLGRLLRLKSDTAVQRRPSWWSRKKKSFAVSMPFTRSRVSGLNKPSRDPLTEPAVLTLLYRSFAVALEQACPSQVAILPSDGRGRGRTAEKTIAGMESLNELTPFPIR